MTNEWILLLKVHDISFACVSHRTINKLQHDNKISGTDGMTKNVWFAKYRVGQKKPDCFLRSHSFATTDDRKTCNMSKVSEFCLK